MLLMYETFENKNNNKQTQQNNHKQNRPMLWKTLYYHNLDETNREMPYNFSESDHEAFKKGELSVWIDYETKENDGIFDQNLEYLQVIDRKRDYMEHIYHCQIPGIMKHKTTEHAQNHLKIFECGDEARLPLNLECGESYKQPKFIHDFRNLRKYGQQCGYSYSDDAESSRYEDLNIEEERWYVFRLRFWRKVAPNMEDDFRCIEAYSGAEDIYQKEGSFTIHELEKDFKKNMLKYTNPIRDRSKFKTAFSSFVFAFLFCLFIYFGIFVCICIVCIVCI